MRCFYTKRSLSDATLGIGLQIAQAESGFGVEIKTQMDILSLSAWNSGCRTGVWGEPMTHFLPLVMNRAHSDRSYAAMRRSIGLISNKIRGFKQMASLNDLEKAIARSEELQHVDSLITMMNSIVVQFAMGSDSFVSDYDGHGSGSSDVPMTMCEKVVLGYSALHHLLLYLQQRNREQVTWLANETVRVFVHRMRSNGKYVCKDLGKLLIYLLLSDYSWRHVSKAYVEESFTRRVKWMVQQDDYKKYDTTDAVPKRAQRTFLATQTSRRLAMFQVWFMRKNAKETLQSYNLRLGRPDEKVRHGVLAQTKKILASKNWKHYFGALGVKLKDRAAIDQLLRFAVYNSAKKGYHRRGYHDRSLTIAEVKMPPMVLSRGRHEVIPKPESAASTPNVLPSQMMQPRLTMPSNRYDGFSRENLQAQPRPQHIMAYQQQRIQMQMRRQQAHYGAMQIQQQQAMVQRQWQQQQQQARMAVQPMMRRAPMVSSNHMNLQAQPRSVAQQRGPFGPAPQFRHSVQTHQMSPPLRQICAQRPMHSQQHIMAHPQTPMMRPAPMMSSNHMNPQAQPRSMAQQCRPFGPAPAVRFGAYQNAQPQFSRPMQTQQMRAPQTQIRVQTSTHSQQTRRRW